jgi:hypothetical protein
MARMEPSVGKQRSLMDEKPMAVHLPEPLAMSHLMEE